MNYKFPVNDRSKVNSKYLQDALFEDLYTEKYFRNLSNIQDSKIIIIGMGGSYMGAKSVADYINAKHISFWNSIDPQDLDSYRDTTFSQSLFYVISKSGMTFETLEIFKFLLSELKRRDLNIEKHIHVITEQNSPLYSKAKELKLNITLHPKEIGGRFSCYSPVLYEALSVAGIDLISFRKGAKLALTETDLAHTLKLYFLQSMKENKYLQILWPFTKNLFSFTMWWQQIWSESLAKQNAKRIFTCSHAFSSISQHSILQDFAEGYNDKHYLFFFDKEDSLVKKQGLANLQALEEAGRTVAHIEIDKTDLSDLGFLMTSFLHSMFLVAEDYRISPYGQPGVERAKNILQSML